jgi:hypothetical protein
MQQVKVQLKNAKVDQRIHKRVTASVSCCQHGGGRSKSGNALTCEAGMSNNGGRDLSIIEIVRKRFDIVKIMSIVRW